MADPNRSTQALGGKKSSTVPKEVSRMSLERTNNGYIKATHQHKGGEPEEIHALPSAGIGEHVSSFFGVSDANERAGIAAKQKNVSDYEKANGPLLGGTKSTAPSVASPDKYDKIREEVRSKQSKPPAVVPDLVDRADKLIKNIGR